MSTDREPDKQTYPAQEQLTEGREHRLKTWPEFFEAIVSGEKTFEVRLDDRGFRVGDVLVLEEFVYHTGAYTGRRERREVTYLLAGPSFGIMRNYVVLGLAHRASTELAKTPTCHHGETKAHPCHAYRNAVDFDVVECPGPPSEPGTHVCIECGGAENVGPCYHVCRNCSEKAPNDEPFREAAIDALRDLDKRMVAAGLLARFDQQADAVLALLPRSVQAPVLTSDEGNALSLAVYHLELERVRVVASWRHPEHVDDVAETLRALLARAARGQDGEQQPRFSPDERTALERILARFRDNKININQASYEIRERLSDSAPSEGKP